MCVHSRVMLHRCCFSIATLPRNFEMRRQSYKNKAILSFNIEKNVVEKSRLEPVFLLNFHTDDQYFYAEMKISVF